MLHGSSAESRAKAHHSTGELIELLSETFDPDLVRFGVSKDGYSEIVEALDGYGVQLAQWKLPPLEMVLNREVRVFELFEMNVPGQLGFECELWACGAPCGPILRGVFASTMDFMFTGIET